MDTNGTVYFFTGLSGAGKTTIGGLFYRRLKATKPNVIFLDGDDIRPVFGEDVGYTQAERLRWAERIFRICRFLSGQGVDVVCCSIAMFRSVRDWNKEHIERYKEIYIKADRKTLFKRNQKELYTRGQNVVGVDLPFEEPQQPDIVIQNDGAQTPLEIVEKLEKELYPNIVQNPIDNTVYWNQYYKNGSCPTEASSFAQYVSTLVEPGRELIDLGCGNGRDAIFFAQKGLQVTAIDLSKEAVSILQRKGVPNMRFLHGDFVNSNIYQPETFDYVYSRFTLHSINHNQAQVLFGNVFCSLRPGGKFFIEVRSVNDPICGKGKQVERNAYFYDFHYRRFIVLDELVGELIQHGFRVEYAEEGTGFAPYGNDDPPLIRVIASKTGKAQ